jgi:hypothetical protein
MVLFSAQATQSEDCYREWIGFIGDENCVSRGGRPKVPIEIRSLIQLMSVENPL